jgi:tetratricopeptide (TPR) repeat protein
MSVPNWASALVVAAVIWGGTVMGNESAESKKAGDAQAAKASEPVRQAPSAPPPEIKPLSGNKSVADASGPAAPHPTPAKDERPSADEVPTADETPAADEAPTVGETPAKKIKHAPEKKGEAVEDEKSDNEADPALLSDSSELATSNIKDPKAVKKENDRVQQSEAQLAMARRFRMEHNPAEAEKILTVLLESPIPDRLKKTALLEMALTAQQANQFAKAQQMLAQYVQRYPQDFNVPEVLLRQGLLFRRMGAPNQALSKFYAVMGTSLNLKAEHFNSYRRLVLQAQTEIADTFYLQGRFEEAIEKYETVLKEEAAELNRAEIRYKLVRCYAALNKPMELIAQSETYLKEYPDEGETAEVRFLLASALKQLNRPSESLKQVLLLLQSKSQSAALTTNDWVYWQQKTGNEIANQLYKEGNYTDALAIYKSMAEMDATPHWRLPVEYQTGLVYERLGQPVKALEMYDKILQTDPGLMTNAAPGLKAVVDMAKWRKEFLKWNTEAEKSSLVYKTSQPDKPDKTDAQ